MRSIILPEVIATGVYNTDLVVKNKDVTAKRKVTMFELELALDDGGISYIDDGGREICRGLLICAKPGQTRRTRLPFKCHYIHAVADGAILDLLSGLPSFLYTERYEYFLSLFERIEQSHSTGTEENVLLMQSLLLELLYSLKKEAARSAEVRGASSSAGSVERALEFIRENLTEDLSLSRVAEQVSLSPIHFHNCFKAATGRTLRSYVEELRIKRAVELLVSTDYTLTKIAFECGFSSQSYFSYAFRRRMKMTPREYAAELQGRYGADG